MKCLIKGTSSSTKKGHVKTFPYSESCNAEKRTKESYLNHANKAVHSDPHKSVYGIKGPCWLSALNNFDIINGIGVDYMHCVLVGVVKTLMKLFFSKEYSKEPFNINNRINDIDEAIKI